MEDFSKELFYKTARSGGKGGQNVNKVETAVEVLWHVASSALFSESDKNLISLRLQNKINKEGYLSVKSSETRSQLENKEIAKQKIFALVAKAITKQKQRKPTKVSKAAKEKRLFSKRQNSLTKQNRNYRISGED